MLIGLDFDNTIANYDSVFKEISFQYDLLEDGWQGTKKELKQIILALPKGEETWMKIQGKVYGEFMHKAELMPGVANFLFHCKIKEIPICVISHKTEYGHFDEKKISLRDEAMKWMGEKNLFNKSYFSLTKDQVFFSNTRKQKVEKISTIGCSHFIDDLVEVFEEPHFPKDTKKILLDASCQDSKKKPSVFNNWTDINNTLLGEQNLFLIENLVTAITQSSPDYVKVIKGGGNSQIYKISLKSEPYVLKIYPDLLLDARPRLETEYTALDFLHQRNIRIVPKPEIKNKDFNSGIYSWVEGKNISTVSMGEIKQCVLFVKKLKEIKDVRFENFNLASEACLSGEVLKQQITTRLNNLNKAADSDKNLKNFINETFQPLFEKVNQKYFSGWPNSSANKNLNKKHLILSPSDFGLHNALLDQDNKITFLDFDYFGWDDPVKLTSDFYWHPGMKLQENHKIFWLDSMISIFTLKDPHFEKRLESALPFYALRWILILLNEFLEKERKRRKHARLTQVYDWEEVKKSQLIKALDLSSSLKRYIE